MLGEVMSHSATEPPAAGTPLCSWSPLDCQLPSQDPSECSCSTAEPTWVDLETGLKRPTLVVGHGVMSNSAKGQT
jgi:hypothetical protein